MKQVEAPEQVLAWLSRADESGSLTGFDPNGWETSVWILNAMYETHRLPGGLTYEDLRRIEAGAGSGQASREEPLDVVLADAVAVGASLGRSAWPGPGWERLRWSELANRLDVDPFGRRLPPCGQSFPYASWPANIAPPAEGSLDREQFVRLIDRLGSAGTVSDVLAFYGTAVTGELDDLTLLRGTLDELEALYDDERFPGSPSNIWPVDRAWFVYTDYDLSGTKVSGNANLIDSLLEDDDLETVVLPF
jgi:hypothetical protein